MAVPVVRSQEYHSTLSTGSIASQCTIAVVMSNFLTKQNNYFSYGVGV